MLLCIIFVECATGILVDISPIRPKDLSTMMNYSRSEKSPPKTCIQMYSVFCCFYMQ